MKPSTRRVTTIAVTACALALWAASGLAQPATTLTHGSAASAGMDADLLDEAARLYRDAVDRRDLKGAVLMVARRGVVVLHEAVGWRHEAYRLPMEPDTLFRMASNTKPVIGAAVLILQEEDRLSLDDRAADHLESFDNVRSRDITIRQLLSHASGLRVRPIFHPFEPDETPTLLGAVAKFGAEGPDVAPGTSYSYNNAGYNAVGAIIEAASGMITPDGAYSHSGSDGTMGWVDPARELIGMVLTQSPGGGNPTREFRELVSRAVDKAADR